MADAPLPRPGRSQSAKKRTFSPIDRIQGHEGLLRIYDLSKPAAEPKAMTQNPDKLQLPKPAGSPISAGADGNIRFWDVSRGSTTGKLVQTLEVGDAEIRDMELTKPSNGKMMLTVAHGTTVSFFDLSDSGEGKLVRAHKMPIHFMDEGGATLHPDGKKFVAGGSDLWVRVFDFETGEELECHKGLLDPSVASDMLLMARPMLPDPRMVPFGFGRLILEIFLIVDA